MTRYRFLDSDRRKWENNSCKRKCKKQLDNQSCKQTNIMCQHLQHHVPTPAPQVTLQLQSLSLGKGLKQNTEGCKKASAWACKRRRARDTIMVSLFRYRLPGTWMRHFQARKAKNRPVFREQFCRYFQPVTE